MPDISPLAHVDPAADLAEDVRVGPFTWIGPEVRIGPGCVIANNVTLTGRTTLGPRNHVFPLAVIGTTEAAGDSAGQVVLGATNAVREHVTIYGGTDAPTRIGNDNLIMIGSQIGPGATVGDHCILPNLTQVGAKAVLADYVQTGAFTFVQAGVTIGTYTFTTGYVTVDRDAPPFAILDGSPFRVRGANIEKLRRCGFSEEDVRQLKRAFRELYSGPDLQMNPSAAEALAAQSDGNPHVRRLAQFLAQTAGAKGHP
jgi:UDP-N-acetylglucosamine acyltransferase